MRYPKELNHLIDFFKKLPGVGKKTAERYAFEMLKWQEKNLLEFSQSIKDLKTNLTYCPECGALQEASCEFCNKDSRDPNKLCIVSSVKDIYVIENTRHFIGIYHVLPHMLSPFTKQDITQQMIETIKKRIANHQVKEIILALDSTLEGDATALFLKEKLQNDTLYISRLALGIPIGSSLDFVDEGTLSRAFSGRLPY